jgi:signal peptidase I
MEDALLIGDYILVSKLGYGRTRNLQKKTPSVGEIIVFRSSEQLGMCVVKRCVAVAQQTVMIRHDGIHIDRQNIDISGSNERIRVPDGYFCVLGDNLPRSDDSRIWGPISQELIVGRAIVIYFSITPNSKRIRWNRIGRRL